MTQILTLQVTIFTLILIGFLVKRRGLVSADGQKNLTDLVIYIILPCNIPDAFLQDLSQYFSDRSGNSGAVAALWQDCLP